MEVIKNKRVLAIVGVAGLIIGCFLPYFVISIFGYTQSISLWGYWEGKIILVLALANALFIFQDFIEKYVPQLFNNWVGNIVKKANNPKFALVPTILVAIFAISLILRIDVDSEYIKYGIGFWTIWLGIVALIGHAIFYKGVKMQASVADTPMPQPIQNTPTIETPMLNPMPSAMPADQFQQQSPIQQPVAPMAAPTMPEQPVAQMQQVVNPMPNPASQIEPAKKFCPECGTQLDATAQSCHMCKHNF